MPGPSLRWDVFHSERLEAERSLTTEQVRDSLDRGDLVADDLVRPSGETRWTRLGDSPEFGPPGPVDDSLPFGPPGLPPRNDFAPPSLEDEAEFEIDPEILAVPIPSPGPTPPPARKTPPPRESDFEVIVDDDEDQDEANVENEDRPTRIAPQASEPTLLDEETARPDLPELDDPEFDDFDPQDEDDEAAEFTLSRNAPETVEELDLAAMVDVAFQLVLFFLVTAQVVLFKTLEVPRPNDDKPPEAAAQARSKSVDELEKDYILVEVDASGAIKVDRQPVPASRPALIERLRTSRETTQRKAMLLSADFATRHENAVLVFDVANEIDLRIAIAQPPPKK